MPPPAPAPHPAVTPDPVDDPVRRHGRHTRRLTLGLLALGAAVTFGISHQARALTFPFFGWPFSFWVGAQGALLVYLLIVAAYAAGMQRLDQALAQDRRPGDAPPPAAG